MSNIELGLRRPNLIHMIALELVFGSSTSELFRGLAERVAEDVRFQARALLETIGDVPTAEAMQKVEFLAGLAHPDEVRFIPLCPHE